MNTLSKFVVAALLISTYSVAAETITVDPTGGADYTNLQDAINYVAQLEQSGYKYTSGSGEQACLTSGDYYVLGAGTEFTNQASIGDQISIDGVTWYEIVDVPYDNVIKVGRKTEVASYTCSSFQVAEVHNIELMPGSYEGIHSLDGVHFIRIKGVGPAESVQINNHDEGYSIPDSGYKWQSVPAAPLHTFESYGAVYIENLTMQEFYGGPVIAQYNDHPQPTNMDLYIDNVTMRVICCDIFFINFGNLVIENSDMRTGVDGVGGDVKSVVIRNSKITTQWQPQMDFISPLLGGVKSAAVHVGVQSDSLIENSEIASFHTGRNPIAGNPAITYGLQIRDTNGATFRINNSNISAVGDVGAAIDLATDIVQGPNGPETRSSTLDIRNSRVEGGGQSAMYDLRLYPNDTVTSTCTIIDEIDDQGGTYTDLGCSQ